MVQSFSDMYVNFPPTGIAKNENAELDLFPEMKAFVEECWFFIMVVVLHSIVEDEGKFPMTSSFD